MMSIQYQIVNGSQCQDEAYFTDSNNKFVKWSISDLKVKTKTNHLQITLDVEGYVSSRYELVFISIFISKILRLICTQGLVVSANAVSMYDKISTRLQSDIKLKGFAEECMEGLNN